MLAVDIPENCVELFHYTHCLEVNRWSAARPVEGASGPVNIHWQFAVTSDGTIHFSGRGPDSRGMGNIYMSRLVDGKGGWTEPVNPGEPINSSSNDLCPMISPDGKYLLLPLAITEPRSRLRP